MKKRIQESYRPMTDDTRAFDQRFWRALGDMPRKMRRCTNPAVYSLILCIIVAWGVTATAGTVPVMPVDGDPADRRSETAALHAPLGFVLNEGQWDTRVLAAGIGAGRTVSFGREGYHIAMRRGANGPLPGTTNGLMPGTMNASMPGGETAGFVTPYPGMRLIAASSRCTLQGREKTEPQLRYLRGEGERFVTHKLDRHLVLRYADAWKGVDVNISGGGSSLRHELHVAAGADPSRVALRFDHVTKEQIVARVQGSTANRLRIEERDGGVDVSLEGAPATAAFTATLVYNYYWGGGGNEMGGGCRVDRAGDVHLTGVTLSADFPLHPSGNPPSGKYSTTFVSVLSADGKSVRYSTVLEQSAMYSINSMHMLAIGKHDRTILQVHADTVSRFLTPDAQFRPRFSWGFAMVVLDDAGAILYGTATPDSGKNMYFDLDTGSDGAIYAVTTVQETQPQNFLTPDAFQTTVQGGSAGLIMKFDPDTYQLTYAGMIGGTGADYLHSIVVDGCGSVAVGGYNSGGGYPVVNAAQEESAGNIDLVFTRFSPDFQRIVFSTYLGGSLTDQSWVWGSSYGWDTDRQLRYDPDGNLYFSASSYSTDFPMMHPVQAQPNGLTELVLGKFSPAGELLFSSYFGGSHHEYGASLDVDACGNMIIRGASASKDLPLRDQFADSGFVFLSVIDTRQSTLRFSSWMPIMHLFYNWHGGGVVLDGTSVYLSQSTWRMTAPPATPGYPDGGGSDSADVQIIRIDMPDLCSRKVFQDKSTENGGLIATLLGTDTLRIDLDRGTFTPPTIGVSCRIRNFSPLLSSDSVIVTLRLPEWLQKAAGGPPLRQALAPLDAGDSVDINWQLLPVIDSIIPRSELHVSVVYVTGGECPSGDGFTAVIPVLYTNVPDAEFRCALSLAPAFEVNRDTTRLAHDTMLVTLRISNISTTPGQLRHAILRILEGSGVTLLAPTDSIVTPALLAGGSHVEYQWLIGVTSWPFGRPLRLAAVLVDTFGIVVAECEWGDDIPGAFGSICGLQVTEPVRVRSDDSSFVPDPVVATLTIYNPSDSLRPYHDLRLDLSEARHIKPVVGETLRRPDFTIEADSSAGFTWLLRISPPPNQSVTETVRAIYRTNADTTERSCDFDVRIILLSSAVDCAVLSPDSLFFEAATARYTQDTVQVSAVVRNTGGLAQDIEGVLLSLDPDGAARLLDPALQGMAQLRPGKSDTVIWNLIVPVLPVPRALRFTVTVTAPGGRVLSSCVDATQVPALPVSCASDAPDSLRYDIATGTYDPPELELLASLENRSDTTYTMLRAVLDDGLLRRTVLAPGETAEQQRAALLPGERWEPRWRLLPLDGERDENERLRVRFFFAPAGTPTLCEVETVIGGAPREVDLRCATAGHDSVWADSYYEALIPDPVQLQYSVRNDGNALSQSCALAILPPAMLELAAGEDSLVTVPALAPGESFAAEWRLRILPDRITSEPWVVRWWTDCADLAPGPSCEHVISFVDRSPSGVVVTPWLLRFSAEREGPLPATQELRLWTGGGTTPRWQVAAQPPWLDAAPPTGGGHTVMTVVPNSTSLPVGVHADVLRLDTTPLGSGDIQVIYDIRTKLGATEPPAPSALSIGSPYPNPVPSGGELRVLLRADPGVPLRLELRDLLGRLRFAEDAGGAGGSDVAVRIPTADLPAGTYVLSVRAGSDAASRMIIVLP